MPLSWSMKLLGVSMEELARIMSRPSCWDNWWTRRTSDLQGEGRGGAGAQRGGGGGTLKGGRGEGGRSDALSGKYGVLTGSLPTHLTAPPRM